MKTIDPGGTVVASQLGARMHYAVPRILASAKRLERLYTDICATTGWPRLLTAVPPGILPGPLRRLAARVPHGIDRDRISCFPALGVTSVLRTTFDKSRARDTETALRAGRAFSEGVVERGFGDAQGFYGISGECLEQLVAARKRGLWTAVEQIIAPRATVDRLVAEEAARFPDWEPHVAHDPHAAAYAAREIAEWAAADLVVCPSAFVRDQVIAAGGPGEHCVVVPYGVDPVRRFNASPPDTKRRRLRVLTVGAVGLRKGSPYLFEAARRMGGLAEFRLVGPIYVAQACARQLSDVLELTGPVSRIDVAAHYAWADIFLLPSVCEGSATVIYEALSAGLPVLTTPNAGSVVTDGHDGFIVPPGDVEAICSALTRFSDDPELLGQMAGNARETAVKHDVAAYGRRLLAALDALPPAREPTVCRQAAE